MVCLGTSVASAAEGVAIPHFRNPTPSAVRPDAGVRVVRFLTAADYPPFQFIDADGAPAGFNADLARAICAELSISCTLQAWKWEDLEEALVSSRADALISSMRITPGTRDKFAFTAPYFRLPARFALQREDAQKDFSAKGLAGKRIAVVQGTAHEAFLRAFFAHAEIVPLPDQAAMLTELSERRVHGAFADGAALSLWLREGNGACCDFAGGPYLESRYFGEGLAIAVRPDDTQLRDLLDFTLDELETRGVLGDLYLKWFPLGIY